MFYALTLTTMQFYHFATFKALKFPTDTMLFGNHSLTYFLNLIARSIFPRISTPGVFFRNFRISQSCKISSLTGGDLKVFRQMKSYTTICTYTWIFLLPYIWLIELLLFDLNRLFGQKDTYSLFQFYKLSLRDVVSSSYGLKEMHLSLRGLLIKEVQLLFHDISFEQTEQLNKKCNTCKYLRKVKWRGYL